MCHVQCLQSVECINHGGVQQRPGEKLRERCEEAGMDAFEINFSCPHGMPELEVGMAVEQDSEILQVRQCSVIWSFVDLWHHV